MSDWIAVGAMAVVAAFVTGGMISTSWLLRPNVPEQGKRAPYESGEVPTGSARAVQFNVQYYLVALVFVVFAVEIAFIIPWAVVFETAVIEVGLVRVAAPMAVFLAVLVAGLGWAWQAGALEWQTQPTPSRTETDQ
jgi:NADH dehydrogenase subunit A (EC 1.6.5.3)